MSEIIGKRENLDVFDGSYFSVLFSSRLVGGKKGREGLWPECHACDKALGLNGKDNTSSVFIPPKAMPLVFSAEQAAKEIGIKLELVDINQMPFIQKLKIRLQGIPLPCMKIGEEFISGMPTKDEIVEFYFNQ